MALHQITVSAQQKTQLPGSRDSLPMGENLC
jgi:hypothetical protein